MTSIQRLRPGKVSSLVSIAALALAIFAPTISTLRATTVAIVGSTDDYGIDSSGIANTGASQTLRIGAVSGGSNNGRNVAYIFPLPNVTRDQRIASASLQFTTAAPVGTPSFDVDLYALQINTTTAPDISYYAGSSGGAPTGNQLLQTSILSHTSPGAATVVTDATGSNALLNYLVTYYDAPGNDGTAAKNLFLRLNPAANPGTTDVGYVATMAESTTVSARPVLTLDIEPRHLYGMLGPTTGNALQGYDNGVRVAVISVVWSRFAPTRGTIDSTYVSQVQSTINSFKSMGYLLQLDPGTQYPPSWVFSAPSGLPAQPERRFMNQYGQAFTSTTPGKNLANFVFSQNARQDLSAYFDQLFATFGTDWHSVRLGGGKYNETNYPENSYTVATTGGTMTYTNSYWAYDVAAQTGAGLVTGLPVCPVPGWMPGNPSPHNEAYQFSEWYLNCMENYHNWQITKIRSVIGFTGPILMLYGSTIVRPGDLTAAVADNLSGNTARASEIAEGKDIQRIINSITDPNVIVHCTWVDAKNFDDSSTNMSNWSPVHFLRYLVDAHPITVAGGTVTLDMWGENTGNAQHEECPPVDLAGNVIDRTFDRMQTYNLKGILWAFENQLFAAPSTSYDYITFADFVTHMQANP